VENLGCVVTVSYSTFFRNANGNHCVLLLKVFCSYINERIKSDNRSKEQACVEEWKVLRKTVADPFTRRRCQPVLVSNVSTVILAM